MKLGTPAPRILMPSRALWTPRPIAVRGPALSVRFETQLCDRHGRVERTLQRGRNTITNWGMDQLASTSVGLLINYLVLSSTQDTRKRAISGGNQLTVTYTSPSNIAVVADANFFEAADAGRTLALPSVPELKITTFTDATHVTCQTPSGDWLPGFTPPGPTVYGSATVYYTDDNTLDTYFTQFNTYDTGGSSIATDDSNSRFIHQRIFLSAVVSGSTWTVNQLGWSDGNGSHNCFGIANLTGADSIPVGKRYRVVLTVYSNYVPINLSGVTANWGGTIGSYTLDIRQEYIGRDDWNGGDNDGNFIQPHCLSDEANIYQAGWWTTAHALVSTYWQGQSGGTPPAGLDQHSKGAVTMSSYTNGQFKRTKNIRYRDTDTITNATALGCAQGGGGPMLTLRPQSGTITKPSGFWADITMPIYWTRDLPA